MDSESEETGSSLFETESDADLEELYASFYSLDDSWTDTDISADKERETTTNTGSPPVYEGASISKLHATLLIFQFALRHGLSRKTFTELLQLLSVLLP